MRRYIKKDIVKKQLELLKFRNTCPVFNENADITVDCYETKMEISWENEHGRVTLKADFDKETYDIEYIR